MINLDMYDDDEKSRLKNALIEAHHRVKNTLQNIISYVNVMFYEKDSISKDDIAKLTRYMHGLSSIHDILLEQVKSSQYNSMVRLDRILSDFLEFRSVDNVINHDYIMATLASTRIASSLCLILSELIDNAQRYGSGNVNITTTSISSDKILIKVQNELCSHTQFNPKHGHGLRICTLLSNAEFCSSFQIMCENNLVIASIEVPVCII